MLENLPHEITKHIAGYIVEDVQAVDPRYHRASRSIQAAWRGWLTRFQKWRCNRCGIKVFLGLKFARQSGHMYGRVAFGALSLEQLRYLRVRIPIDCDTCLAVRHLYATAGT